MENREWLENLKVGDKVVNLRSQYTTITRKIVEVTKVTKKYIVIGDSKYRKDDGRYVDRNTWGGK
jgi:hypothetical protein